jgi:hypothetical protein
MSEHTEDPTTSDQRLREHLIALGFIRPARPASEHARSNMRRTSPDYLRLVHPERSNGRTA